MQQVQYKYRPENLTISEPNKYKPEDLYSEEMVLNLGHSTSIYAWSFAFGSAD